MESDYYISILNSYSEYGVKLTDEQLQLINNLEKILQHNLRDDYALLCNLYNLYQTVNKKNVSLANLANSDSLLVGDKVGNKMRITELLGHKFGLSEKTIYNYLAVAGRFIDFLAGEKFVILELKDYTIAKLQELLPVSNEVIRNAFADKVLTYKSSRAEIRAFVKSCKGTSARKVVDESSEQEDIDPDSNYNVSLSMPQDVYQYVQDLVLKRKKYASLEEYILALVRQDMRK